MRLVLFTAPVVALVPYYATVFATSYVAVGNVLTSQNYWALASERAGLVSRAGRLFLAAHLHFRAFFSRSARRRRRL